MKIKFFSLLLALVLAFSCLTGCSTVSDIAGNVADAAMKELETQIKDVLEEYKVQMVEFKTTAGKLNGTGNEIQFFCAVLIQADSDTTAKLCANALDGIFEETGVVPQTSSQIKSLYLEHKTLSYKHTDFSAGNYYTIDVYSSNITPDLSSVTGK
jgi:hypothetical protein